MGVSHRKEQEKEIRRKDIIDAAEEVFFSKGYEAATMDDVAKKAEFSKRTVYVYFNSKEQLHFEIMVRGYRLMIERIETSLAKQKDMNALEKIKRIGLTLYQFNIDFPNYFDAIMSYENNEKDFDEGITDQSKEECYALGEIMFGFLRSTLEEGIKEGTLRSNLDVISTSIIIWSFTLGLFNTLGKKKNYFENYHHKNSEDLVNEGLSMLMSMVKNTHGGKGNEEKK